MKFETAVLPSQKAVLPGQKAVFIFGCFSHVWVCHNSIQFAFKDTPPIAKMSIALLFSKSVFLARDGQFTYALTVSYLDLFSHWINCIWDYHRHTSGFNLVFRVPSKMEGVPHLRLRSSLWSSETLSTGMASVSAQQQFMMVKPKDEEDEALMQEYNDP